MAPTTTATPSLATQITNLLLGLATAAAEIGVKNPEHAATVGEILAATGVLIPGLLAILMPVAAAAPLDDQAPAAA